MNAITCKNALWLTTAAALAASAVPASAEVYLTEAQALGVILGDKAIVRREQKTLDLAMRKKLEQENNLRFPEGSYTFFVATQDGRPAKYALVLNEIGKTEPITFMVGMSPEGKITEVVIMEFRENRGWEVKEKRFLNQFRGKTVRNAIRVDEDIINYTGATLSSKAIARGVKRALLLLDAFYPGESRTKLGAARDFAEPRPLTPISITQSAYGSLGLYRQVRYAMGTQCEIRAWCASPNEAKVLFNSGFRELDRIEQVFTAYREDSELSKVNHGAGSAAVEVSEEFFEVAQEALRNSRETQGTVDITIGPLLNAWGFRQSKPRIPSDEEIFVAKRLVGNEKVILDDQARSIRFQYEDMELDFGGIAKGYAAEKIGKGLEKLGAASSLVNLGRSSLFASRVNHDAGSASFASGNERIDQWPVAVTHPDGQGAPLLCFSLQAGKALSTSGTTERQFEKGKRRFSHIINPSTGLPIEGTSSATVIAEDGILCEVASKELLLIDSTRRKQWDAKRRLDGWAHFAIAPSGELVENLSSES